MMVVLRKKGDSVNTDPKKSATYCGCDEGANHVCEMHRKKEVPSCGCDSHGPCPSHRNHVVRALDNAAAIMKTLTPVKGSAEWRKQRPLYSGCIAYFPDALMEVAYVSFKGNQQHNPGQPLHWAKEKSADHLDAEARHVADHSKDPVDSDGALHLAKNAWRALAELQVYLDREKA
jgi:hypothetical protein